jgi:hypothetical protein
VRGSVDTQCVCNCLKDAIHIFKYIVIPEPQDTIPLFAEPFVANRIPFVCSVLASVEFNHQASFAANEVGYIGTDWSLANNFVGLNL